MSVTHDLINKVIGNEKVYCVEKLSVNSWHEKSIKNDRFTFQM